MLEDPGSRPPDRPGRDPRRARSASPARSCARRWSGSSSGRLPGHPAQAREPAADQRLQAARRRERGGDAVGRRARSAASGRSAPATPGRASPTRRAKPACRARWSRSRPRRPRSSSACGRSARDWFWCPTTSPGRRSSDAPIPGVEGTFIHPFDDHDFIAGHATMGLEILEDAPDTAAVIAGDRRRRADHGRRQRGQGAQARHQASWAPSRRPRRPRAPRSRRDRRRRSRTGRRRSSTAPAARASSRACGSA